MYRSVFTVGIVLVRGNSFDFDDALTNYSYIYARRRTGTLVRCMTGLGPNDTDNDALGGLYFNGNKIQNKKKCDSQDIIISKPGPRNAGVFNILQCGGEFSTTAEGIYKCTLMNSSMMNEFIRFGVYFIGRSELLDVYSIT